MEILTRDKISEWLKRAAKDDRYMIVWADTYDYTHYPSFYKDEDSAQLALDNPHSMQKAMEAYDLLGDLDQQIARSRTWAPALRRYR